MDFWIPLANLLSHLFFKHRIHYGLTYSETKRNISEGIFRNVFSCFFVVVFCYFLNSLLCFNSVHKLPKNPSISEMCVCVCVREHVHVSTRKKEFVFLGGRGCMYTCKRQPCCIIGNRTVKQVNCYLSKPSFFISEHVAGTHLYMCTWCKMPAKRAQVNTLMVPVTPGLLQQQSDCCSILCTAGNHRWLLRCSKFLTTGQSMPSPFSRIEMELHWPWNSN